MRTAILADIQGNLEALDAVLEDALAQECARIVGLGSTMGYGPDPEACLDRMSEVAAWCLLGYQEWCVLKLHENPKRNWGEESLRLSTWLLNRLRPGDGGDLRPVRRWKWMQELEGSREEGDILFVHGTPHHPALGFITPERAVSDPKRLRAAFERVSRVAFAANTHIPMFLEEGKIPIVPPEEIKSWRLGSNVRTWISAGSVGQPRDGNPKACYMILDGDHVMIRRVAYDFEATAAKMRRLPEVAGHAGRLALGR